jgi:hypothetical protein
VTVAEAGFEAERGSRGRGRGRGGRGVSRNGSGSSGGESETGGRGEGGNRGRGRKGRGRGGAVGGGQRTLTQIGRKESGGRGQGEKGHGDDKEASGREAGKGNEDDDLVEVDGSSFRAGQKENLRESAGLGGTSAVADPAIGGGLRSGQEEDVDRKGKRKVAPDVAKSPRRGAKRRRKALPAVHFYALESEQQQVLEVVRRRVTVRVRFLYFFPFFCYCWGRSQHALL